VALSGVGRNRENGVYIRFQVETEKTVLYKMRLSIMKQVNIFYKKISLWWQVLAGRGSRKGKYLLKMGTTN
jgi:hypothetical protein